MSENNKKELEKELHTISNLYQLENEPHKGKTEETESSLNDELKNTKKYLSRFGFKICKIVSTGIHPERIPFVKKHGISENNFIFKAIKLVMKFFKYGDTYEVYCKKVSGIKNEQ